MTLVARLATLERLVVVESPPVSWAEWYAAHDRECRRAVAHLCELFGRIPLPFDGDTPEQEARDAEVLAAHARAHPAPEADPDEAYRVLAERLDRLAAVGQLEERLDRFSVRPERAA